MRLQVVTVPIVLSQDHATILSLAQNTGGMVNTGILKRELNWDKKRSMLALNVLLREGMTWVDEQVLETTCCSNFIDCCFVHQHRTYSLIVLCSLS